MSTSGCIIKTVFENPGSCFNFFWKENEYKLKVSNNKKIYLLLIGILISFDHTKNIFSNVDM